MDDRVNYKEAYYIGNQYKVAIKIAPFFLSILLIIEVDVNRCLIAIILGKFIASTHLDREIIVLINACLSIFISCISCEFVNINLNMGSHTNSIDV